MNFEEMVERAVNAKAKMGLRSNTMVRDSDIHCPKGYHPSNSTGLKVQTKGIIVKESKPKKSKLKESKLAKGKNPALPRSKSIKPGKISRTNKKSEYLKKKRDRKNNTSATRDNANGVEGGEKKRNDRDNGRCYNCQKKGHFLKNCPKAPKN